jgi:hypothetical protein
MNEQQDNQNNSEFIIFKTDDEQIAIDVRFDNESVWLTQDQMALLFDKAKSTINEHIKNIFEEGELVESLCLQKFGISEFQQKTPTTFSTKTAVWQSHI